MHAYGRALGCFRQFARNQFAATGNLAEYGCSRSQLLSVHGETRRNITFVDGVTGEHTHVRTTGFPVRQEDFDRLRRKLGLLAGRGTTIVFAGSLPPGIGSS